MRTCVLLTALSGSTFMRYMLMDGKTTMEGAPNPNKLHTTPVATHYNEDYPNGNLVTDRIMHASDGDAPEFYSFHVGLDAGPAFYNNLPGPKDDWRFIYILRDPREKVAATVAWSKQDANPDRPSSVEIFERECALGKKRAESVLSMRGDARFKIFLFEDMVRNTLGVFGQMMEFGGVTINRSYYGKLLKGWRRKNDSAFDGNGDDAIARWSEWTRGQKTYFKSVLGQELIDYGFERDNDWLAP